MKKLSKRLQTRLNEMEESLKEDSEFKLLMDEFTETLYKSGTVSEELQVKIHSHLEKRFPRIRKGKRRKKKTDELKQVNN